MDYQDNDERGRKIKIIAIATAAAVVVLAFGAWIIVAAISSVNGNHETEQVAENNTEVSEPKAEEDTGTGKQSTTVTTKPLTPQTVEEDTVVENDNIPTTGPEDILPVAILMGIAAYLVTLNLTSFKTVRLEA